MLIINSTKDSEKLQEKNETCISWQKDKPLHFILLIFLYDHYLKLQPFI